MNKYISHIGFNTIRTFIVPLTLFTASYFVINYHEKSIWGEFIVDLLLVNLIVHLSQWGNKDYLVRNFSQHPNKIQHTFYQSLFTRSFFLIPAFGILIFFSSDLIKSYFLLFWIIGLFIYQSAESLIIYEKAFRLQVVIEGIVLTLILTTIFFKEDVSELDIVVIFTLTTWFKVIIVYFKLLPKLKKVTPNFNLLSTTFPFFIIGLSGLLQSRVDQYIIANFCDKVTLADYQLFLSAFILIQALSAVTIAPYNKIIYRVNLQTFKKIQRKILLLGVLTVLLIVPIVGWILNHLYWIEIDFIYYVGGTLFAFPTFVYGPIIYLFYRLKKEKEVMIVNYTGAAFNLIITSFLVIYYDPFSTIFASAFAQWVILIWYLYRRKIVIPT